MSGILSGDSTLDGETSTVDVFLGETQLLESDTTGNLDLGGNDVDSGDLL